VTARTAENANGSAGVETGAVAFVKRTERDFWLDPDGKNRWIPAFNEDGSASIEDHQGAEEACSACGTQIRWLCFVRHPTRGFVAVGRCCINKVIRSLPQVQQGPYREAVGAINREMQNVVRRSRGKPVVVGRKERLRNHIIALETASHDPRLHGVTWLYNGEERRLGRDLIWYLNELKAGRRHSSFQSVMKGALSRNGHPEVFA
jgi:hypothetical protein